MEAYIQSVSPYEIVDVEAAVNAFLTGNAPGLSNSAFAPSAPMVGAEIRRQMNLRLDSERRAIRPTLPKPDIERSPEAQARVRALVEKTVAGLMSITADEDESIKARRREMMLRASQRAEDEAYRNSDAYQERYFKPLGYETGDPDGRED